MADAILARLLDEAEKMGLSQVFLETGSQEAFGPARAFFARHGFCEFPPFEGYSPDPASAFFSRTVAKP